VNCQSQVFVCSGLIWFQFQFWFGSLCFDRHGTFSRPGFRFGWFSSLGLHFNRHGSGGLLVAGSCFH